VRFPLVAYNKQRIQQSQGKACDNYYYTGISVATLELETCWASTMELPLASPQRRRGGLNNRTSCIASPHHAFSVEFPLVSYNRQPQSSVTRQSMKRLLRPGRTRCETGTRDLCGAPSSYFAPPAQRHRGGLDNHTASHDRAFSVKLEGIVLLKISSLPGRPGVNLKISSRERTPSPSRIDPCLPTLVRSVLIWLEAVAEVLRVRNSRSVRGAVELPQPCPNRTA
jgi:hypothetical protein